MKYINRLISSIILFIGFVAYGCSGSGGGGTVPSGVVSITVSPKTANLSSVRVQSFTAAVSGSSNAGVTWTTSGGAITPDGIFIATAAGSFTVTATSQADSSKSVTATVTVTPSYPRSLYTANDGDASVSAFTVNSATGQLRGNGFASFGASNPRSVAVDPTGKYLYLAYFGNNILVEFAATSSGSLSMIGASDASVNTNLNSPISIDIEPNGKYLYVLNSNSNPNTVSFYGIGSATGLLTYIGSANIGSGTGSPAALAADPSGRFVYVIDSFNDKIFAFKIGSDGSLSAIGTANTGPVPSSLSVDPLDRFVYVTNKNSNTVYAFTIGPSGALSLISTVINTGNGPNGVTVDPAGQYAYVVNNTDKTVQAYSITSSGSLSLFGTAVSTGVNPLSIKIDPTGKFAYVANSGENSVTVYNITNGLLTYSRKMKTQNGPASLAITKGSAPVSYIPLYAFVANYVSGNVYQYSISVSNGSLTQMGSPVATGGTGSGTYSIAADPTGRFAYVVDYSSSNIYQFTISNGILSPQPTPTIASGGTGPVSIAIDPNGKHAFVINAGGTPNVSVFSIDNLGALSSVPLNSCPTGLGPFSAAADPTGKFVLVANFNDSTVSSYQYDQTGLLCPNPSNARTVSINTLSTSYAHPYSVTIDPSGRFAYTANNNGGSGGGISLFLIGLDGSLTLQNTYSDASGLHAIVVEPSGKYLYVSNDTTNNISRYTIDWTTGSLTPFTNLYFKICGSTCNRGQNPYSISIDPSGSYIYTANYSTYLGTNPGYVWGGSISSSGDLTNLTGGLDDLGSPPGPYFQAGAGPQAIVTTAIIQ